MSAHVIDRVIGEIDRAVDEIVAFTSELVRIPTVNPPGEAYEPCARLIGNRLARGGFEIEYITAEGRPEHTSRYPRVNVVGRRRGSTRGPVVHFNGHTDVVPAGDPKRVRRRPWPRAERSVRRLPPRSECCS